MASDYYSVVIFTIKAGVSEEIRNCFGPNVSTTPITAIWGAGNVYLLVLTKAKR